MQIIEERTIGTRTLAGTEHPVRDQLARDGDSWVMIRALCNGVPEQASEYSSEHVAREAWANRARDLAEDEEERERAAAAYRAERDALQALVEARLAQPVPDELPEQVIGLCSRSRAEDLMMAAANAGGAIFVRFPLPARLYDHVRDQWGLVSATYFLALGCEAVDCVEVEIDRREVIEALREALAEMPTLPELDEEIRSHIAMLDRIEGVSR